MDLKLIYIENLICKIDDNFSTPYHNFIFIKSEIYEISYMTNKYGYDLSAYITQEEHTHKLPKGLMNMIFLDKTETRDFLINQIINE